MKLILFILCFSITNFNLYSQKPSLSDSLFIAMFKEDSLMFNKIKPDLSSRWELIAGRGEYSLINHTKAEEDSINKVELFYRDTAEYNDEIKKDELDILYNKCLIENYFNKNRDSICDLIKAKIRKVDSNFYERSDEVYKKANKVTKEFYHKKAYKVEFTYSTSSRLTKETKKMNLYDMGGFGTWCPPSGCSWFFLSSKKKGIDTINNFSKLKQFLGKIDNPYKAFLLTIGKTFGSSIGYPIEHIKMKYLKVGDIYYFIKSVRLSDCPITYFECLISVENSGDIKIIDKIKQGESGGCI